MPLLLITSPCHEVALGLHGCKVLPVGSLSSPGRLIYFFCLDCLEGSIVDLGTRTLYSQMHVILGITGLPCLVGEMMQWGRETGQFSITIYSMSSLFCMWDGTVREGGWAGQHGGSCHPVLHPGTGTQNWGPGKTPVFIPRFPQLWDWVGKHPIGDLSNQLELLLPDLLTPWLLASRIGLFQTCPGHFCTPWRLTFFLHSFTLYFPEHTNDCFVVWGRWLIIFHLLQQKFS